jgi:hypothetical protein
MDALVMPAATTSEASVVISSFARQGSAAPASAPAHSCTSCQVQRRAKKGKRRTKGLLALAALAVQRQLVLNVPKEVHFPGRPPLQQVLEVTALVDDRTDFSLYN